MTILPTEPHLLDVLQGFVHELRTAGLPVSMTENLDAMRAIEYVPLDDRAAFKAAGGYALPTIWIGPRELIGAQSSAVLAEALHDALAHAGS